MRWAAKDTTTGRETGRYEEGRAKARPLHRRTHYGAGKLHAMQGDGMEAGAARRWRGGQSSGGLRLRDGEACVARNGARKNPEALQALRFLELCYRPYRWEDPDSAGP